MSRFFVFGWALILAVFVTPGLAAVAAVVDDVDASSATSGGNILPTTFPVSQFPVPTQTHFPSPSCSGSSSASQQFTVNYNFESVQSVFPTTALSQIKVYNLLNFLNINAVNTDPDFDGNHLGLAPYTYPNAAAFTLLISDFDQLTNPGSNGIATVTADYIESTISSWVPHSFYYGCVLPSPYTAGSFPTSCNITATGYNAAGNRVASQVFSFATNGSEIQDQKYGQFNAAFQHGIYSLTFGVTQNSSSAALIDNLIATVQQQACAPYYTGSYNDGGASPP